MSESKAQRLERLSTKALWMRLDWTRKVSAKNKTRDAALTAKFNHQQAVLDADIAESKYLVAEEEYLAARLEGDVQ